VAKVRPWWRKGVGIGVLAFSVAIIVANWVARIGLDVIPGGHQEWYFGIGVIGGLIGMWLLGAFDA